MSKLRRFPLAAMAAMAVFSLLSVVPQRPALLPSVTLAVGIAAFFITERLEKAEGGGDVFALKKLPGLLRDRTVLLLIVMPSLMNVICNAAAMRFLPAFFGHLKDRTGFLALDMLPLLAAELVVAALGEEIAWRAFFQRQLSKAVPFPAALVLVSALFALCHFNQGELAVVLYDILFVWINALFYGLVFRRTDSVLLSTLAHFLANLTGIIEVMLL